MAQSLGKKSARYVETASVVVSLLDGQRFGEWDRAELRPEPPDRSLLPPKTAKSYIKPAKDTRGKTMATLLPPDAPLHEEQTKVNRCFRQAIGLHIDDLDDPDS